MKLLLTVAIVAIVVAVTTAHKNSKCVVMVCEVGNSMEVFRLRFSLVVH